MPMTTLFLLVIVLSIVTLVLAVRGGQRHSWLEFQLRAKDSGFGYGESRILREAATLCRIADPASLFSSPRDLDRAIAFLLARQRDLGRDRSREGIALMDKVYALRSRIEFEQPRYKSGIRSSRQLSQGQRLRVLVHGLGVYGSTVIDNNGRYLVLSYPSGARLPKNFVWKGKKVSIYFWRRDDAGYVFDSYAIDDLRIRNVPVIHVAHSESLLRTQKRKSVRSRTSLPAYLYLLKRIEGAFEKPERDPGLRCRVEDISEDGFSVAIGGRGKAGLQVKVQFSLEGRQIVMSGVARSVDYDSEKNRSVLHVEASPPSPRTRNAIRSYVYKIRAEGELEPLSVESEEAGAGVS